MGTAAGQERGSPRGGLPDPRLFRGILGDHNFQRAGILEDLFHAHGLVGDLRRVPVHFNEQDGRRVTRQTDIHVILNIVDGRVVHEFQRTGDNMRGDDPGDGLRGAFHFGENGHHGFGSLGRRHQFEDGLAGKCQRAFRGDEQFGEVVAVLAPPAASPGLHDFAGFGQDFKAHDIFFRGAVLQAAQPAGVLGDVAAHGGDGHGPGVGRIKQPAAATAAARSQVITPGSTTAYISSSLISRILSKLLVRIMTASVLSGMVPPLRFVPEPRIVMGMPSS